MKLNNRRGQPLIITVKEAQKLLGVKSKQYTKGELQALIEEYTVLARYAVKDYLVRK